MSNEALRAISLQEAVKVAVSKGNSIETASVIQTANTFLAFLSGPPAAAPAVATPAAEPPKPTAAAPAKPAKPAAPKAPAKPKAPVKTEEQIAAEALAAAEAEAAAEGDEGEGAIDWSSDDGKKAVNDAVAAFIAANRRAEAISLLAKFKATSVSGVKTEQREAFVTEANELLATDIQS